MMRTLFAVTATGLLLCGCQTTRFTHRDRDTVWETTPGASTRERHAPESRGGRLHIGKQENDIHGNEDGFSTSKGIKTINCGDGSSCELEFSISGTSSGPAPDGEQLEISFLDRNGVPIRITSARTTGPGDYRSSNRQKVEYPRQLTNPLKVTLPSCGQINIEVTVSEGPTAALQSSWTVMLNRTRCR